MEVSEQYTIKLGNSARLALVLQEKSRHQRYCFGIRLTFDEFNGAISQVIATIIVERVINKWYTDIKDGDKPEFVEVKHSMRRYIAFLRGINISGKNKVPMADLKVCFEELGFADVKTYLNSGNVAFSSEQDDIDCITDQLEQMIKDTFCIHSPVFVILQKELEDVLNHFPEWWGNDNKEIYDNLIFILKPVTFQTVIKEIGNPKEGLEQIQDYHQTVFWSFNRKEYQKTNWWSKTASANIGNKLTIRTANTVRKIVGM